MIDSLKTFLAVASSGNFSEVARQQDVAVSSVTRKVDALEAELGTALFHRSSRRIHLTDAGEQFVPRARTILSEIAAARDALHQLDDLPRGPLTVAAPTVFGRRHVVPAVAGFMHQYPGVEVDLHLSDQVIDLAEQGVDVAIRIGVLPDSDLQATLLAPVRLVTCASPAYLARAGRPASPVDLLQHECISVATPPAPSFIWRYAGVNRNQPLAVRGRFRTDDKDGMLQAALGGLGVLHIATWVVSDHLRDGSLVALFPHELTAPPAEAAHSGPGCSWPTCGRPSGSRPGGIRCRHGWPMSLGRAWPSPPEHLRRSSAQAATHQPHRYPPTPQSPMVAVGNSGRLRTRWRVSAYKALASAGAKVGTPSSPTPPMALLRSVLAGRGMICTSTRGICCGRITGLVLKLRRWAAPFTKVC